MRGLWIASCTLLLVLAGSAFAQIQTYDFLGGGARAEGMGNAFIGVSNDVSALTWNPAGLTAHDRPTLGLAWGSFRPRGGETILGTGAELEYDYNGSFSNLTFASFLAPVRIRGQQFVLAGAYTQTLEDFWGNNSDILYEDMPHDVLHGIVNDINYSLRDAYHAAPMMINLGLATSINPKIDAGLAINIYNGKASLERVATSTIDDYIAVDRQGQSVLRVATSSRLDTSSYSGVNFSLGLKYKATKWTAGLLVKSGFALEDLQDQKYGDTVRYNGQVSQGRSYFVDDVLVKYNIPWVFGAGFGYNIRENWLWALDAEYRGFSGKTVEVRTVVRFRSGGEKEEVFEEYDPQWYNVFTVRTGTEYLLNTNSRLFPVVPLRAGFALVPIPTPDFDYNIVDDTTIVPTARRSVSMYRLSAGTGVHWSQIHLDVAYTYSVSDREGTSDLSYEIRNRNHRLNFMFTGYF